MAAAVPHLALPPAAGTADPDPPTAAEAPAGGFGASGGAAATVPPAATELGAGGGSGSSISSGPAGGGRMSSPSLRTPSPLPVGAGNRWIEGLVAVKFDIGAGQVVEAMYPHELLQPALAKVVAHLAMPEGMTSGADMDVTLTFRLRTDSVPLFATGPTAHSFMFGFVCFSSRRDPAVARGFVQSSIVVLSVLPFYSHFQRVARRVMEAYQGSGPKALEAAYREIATWPPIQLGQVQKVPLLGTLFSVRPTATISDMMYLTGTAAASGSSTAPSSPGGPRPGASPSSGLSVASGEDSDSDVDDSKRGADSRSVSRATSPGGRAEPHADGDASRDTASEPVGSRAQRPAVTPPPPILTAGRPGSPLALAGSPVTLEDSVISSRTQSAGTFTDVGIYSGLQSVLHHLWHLWSLVITGQPILVLAPRADMVSLASLAIVSLISPIPFRGDLRPYMTIYDPDFRDVCDLHDSTHGKSLPQMIIGITNPVVLKSLSNWPNIVCVCDLPVSPRSSPSKRVHSKASTIDKALTAAVASGSWSPLLATPNGEGLAPEPAVMAQLLHCVPSSDVRQLRVSETGAVSFGESGDGDVPAVVINNAVLRRHFTRLTEEFLEPFEAYFQGSAPDSAASVGPYDDAVGLMLPKFNEGAFIRRLELQGVPKMLRRMKWRKLYAGFISSPHFWPWFRARRLAAGEKYLGVSRALRMSVTVEQLLHSIGIRGSGDYLKKRAMDTDVDRTLLAAAVALVPSADQSDKFARNVAVQTRCVSLRTKILSTLQRENARLAEDPEHLSVILMHLRAVEHLLVDNNAHLQS